MGAEAVRAGRRREGHSRCSRCQGCNQYNPSQGRRRRIDRHLRNCTSRCTAPEAVALQLSACASTWHAAEKGHMLCPSALNHSRRHSRLRFARSSRRRRKRSSCSCRRHNTWGSWRGMGTAHVSRAVRRPQATWARAATAAEAATEQGRTAEGAAPRGRRTGHPCHGTVAIFDRWVGSPLECMPARRRQRRRSKSAGQQAPRRNPCGRCRLCSSYAKETMHAAIADGLSSSRASTGTFPPAKACAVNM
jgi:hypothetical protein